MRIDHQVLKYYDQEKKSYAEHSSDQFPMYHLFSSSVVVVIAHLMAWTALQKMLM